MRRFHNSVDEELICDHCSKMFKTQNKLYLHIKSVHEVENLPCKECGKIYKNSYALRKHIKHSHSKGLIASGPSNQEESFTDYSNHDWHKVLALKSGCDDSLVQKVSSFVGDQLTTKPMVNGSDQQKFNGLIPIDGIKLHADEKQDKSPNLQQLGENIKFASEENLSKKNEENNMQHVFQSSLRQNQFDFCRYYQVQQHFEKIQRMQYHTGQVNQINQHQKTSENDSDPLIRCNSMIPKEEVINDQLPEQD